MLKRALVLVSFFALAACSSASEDVGADDSEITAACGSAIGDAVLAAAASGDSTVPGRLDTRRNRFVSGPHVGGAAIMDAMDELVASAHEEVLIEIYDVEEDSWMGKRLRDAVRKLPSSVKVWVNVTPNQGVRLFGILPETQQQTVARLEKLFDRPNVTVGAWDIRGLLGVMHTKAVVVDGKRAMILDANLQNASDPREDGGKGWYQQAMVVEGAIAGSLRGEAAGAWRHAYSKEKPALGSPSHAIAGACSRMIPLGRDAEAGEGSSADKAYAQLFRAAKKEVHVMTPNLNDDHAVAALADATADADVYVVLSKGFNDSSEKLPTQGGTNEQNVGRLAKDAKNPCNLHLRWFSRAPNVAIDGNGNGASHSKWASVDGQTMILGSQNLDTQSWKKSRELSVAVDDEAVTKRFDAVFHDVWARGPVAFECKR